MNSEGFRGILDGILVILVIFEGFFGTFGILLKIFLRIFGDFR